MIIHNIIGWNELLTGIYRFADLNRLDKYGQFSFNTASRIPISIYANTNDYATMLVLGIFILYIVYSNSSSKLVKISTLCVIFSSILLLLRTNSRANILGLLAGTTVFAFLKFFKKITVKKMLIATSIPIFVFNPITLNKILTVCSRKLRFNFDKGSDFIRLNLIKNGLLFLINTFGFGVGAGNIEYWMEKYKLFYTGRIVNMHNWWMEILVSYGIIVFVFYVWIYLKMYKILYASYIKTDDMFIRNSSLGFISIMTAFIISSVSSSSILGSAWIWIIWGLIIAFIGYIGKYSSYEKIF